MEFKFDKGGKMKLHKDYFPDDDDFVPMLNETLILENELRNDNLIYSLVNSYSSSVIDLRIFINPYTLKFSIYKLKDDYYYLYYSISDWPSYTKYIFDQFDSVINFIIAKK